MTKKNGHIVTKRHKPQQTTTMIIEQSQANDTLVIALNKPSKALRTTYYCCLALIVGAVAWASVSVVDIAVHAQGFIRPTTGMQNVISPATGYIATLLVRENQTVSAGDTLAILEAEPLREREQLSEEKLRRTQAEIADLRTLSECLGSEQESLPSAASAFHFPMYEREYRVALKERETILNEIATFKAKAARNKELAKKDFISKEEIEQAATQVNQKELALKQWQHERMKSIFERLQRAEFVRMEEGSTLKSIGIEKSRTVLRAPISGYITELNFKTAQTLVNAGTTLCSISPNGEQIAEFYIPARDIGFVREGLKVRYQIDAFPFQEWGVAHGNIRVVSKDYILHEKSQQALFKVTGTFSSMDLHSPRRHKEARLQSGMSFRAGVIVAEKRLITTLWDRTIEYFTL